MYFQPNIGNDIGNDINKNVMFSYWGFNYVEVYIT